MVGDLTPREYLLIHPGYLAITVLILGLLVIAIILFAKERQALNKLSTDNVIIESLISDYISVDYVSSLEDENSDILRHYRTNNVFNAAIPEWNEIKGYELKADKLLEKYGVEDECEDVRFSIRKVNVLQALTEGDTYYVNCKLRIKDRVTQYQLRYVADKDESGEIRGFVVGAHDIDEEFKADEKYKRELEDARNRAEAANTAKSVFLFNMSHDIRTPMNAIKGYTELAERNIGNDTKVRECLKKVQTAEEQLLKLINDVLDMSRIESGKTQIEKEKINMRQIVDNIASIVGGQLLGREIDFKVEFENCIHDRLIGDELHLRQVLVNILGNAVKFTNDDGTILFRIREVNHGVGTAWYEFLIKDDGIGMKPEFVEHIWESFSQEHDSARSEYKGTGLGMAIAKKLVILMGGTIEVNSEYGVGTQFTVLVPFGIDDSPVPKKENGNTMQAVDLKGVKILLAEDNELNREIAVEMLEDEGAIVTCAENGQEAVDIYSGASEGTFDVILMDIMMPKMNGYEATASIRALSFEETRKIPIIALSANAFAEDVKRSLDAGMNGHVSKPINIETLKNAIVEALC